MTNTPDVRAGLIRLARPILGVLNDPEPRRGGRFRPLVTIQITAIHFSTDRTWLEIRPRGHGYSPIFFFQKDKVYELRIHDDEDKALIGPLLARATIGARRLALIFEVTFQKEEEALLRDLAQVHLL